MRRFNLTIIITLFVGLFGLLSHSDAQDPKINLQGLLSKRVPILFGSTSRMIMSRLAITLNASCMPKVAYSKPKIGLNLVETMVKQP